jgi:hypothetical protein
VKKLLIAIMCLVLLVTTAMPTLAHHRHRHRRSYAHTTYSNRYVGHRRVYYSYGPRRTFWQKHRDKLTVAMGTGGGAILGGLIGGKRGAGIGALAGAGGSALYTYKIRNRHRRY